MYESKVIKNEIVNVNTRVVSKARVEGYICPWEPVCSGKVLSFANFNETVAVTNGEEGPNTFPLFNIVEICSFLNPNPVWQKLRLLLGTIIL